jgi:hypothetical protein
VQVVSSGRFLSFQIHRLPESLREPNANSKAPYGET